MTFCTVINCIDGRVQLITNEYLRHKFKAEYVDTITEAGPNRILADRQNMELVNSILERVRISIDIHLSKGLAIVGHYDCAGNPVADDVQIEHTIKSAVFLRKQFPNIEIIPLWINKEWQITEI
jgi:hypothetical protein